MTTIEWFNGGLAESEQLELYCLEYVLIWGYTDNWERDEVRHKELSTRKWNFRDNNPIQKQLIIEKI